MGEVRQMRRRGTKTARTDPGEYDGIPLPGKPGAVVPQIPLGLSDTDDPELMTLFATYVAWQNFISVLLVGAEIREAQAETELKVTQASALVDSWGGTKEDRVAVARAERELDPAVREQQAAYDTARAHRKMLSVLAQNMERAAALVSRELTRRVGRTPMERRVGSWSP